MGKQILVILIVIAMFFGFAVYVLAAPNGGTLTPLNNSTAQADVAGKSYASAGNVTQVNVFGYSTTQLWQGYYGNVTGVVQLADGARKVMYNWSLTNPRGQVYSSVNQSVIWSNIRCFSFYANGTKCDPTEYATSKGTMAADGFCGMNITQLMQVYNINESDIDNINNTFQSNNHTQFYTNNLQFDVGECNNTYLLNASGQGKFDEVLLFSPEMNTPVYASILKNDLNGFDGNTNDFEMIVPENGHGSDTSTTAYYFYVELY